MSKNYPTVRRGREVAGAGGIGKVQIIYKPKKPKPYCLMFLGFIVYSLFLGTYFTSFFWSRPQIRGHIIIPIWKKLVFGGDYVRVIANKLLRQQQLPQQDTASMNVPMGDHELSGSSEEAVVYQQGYVHAKERLFQMDVYRRMALGTLTEVFGNKTLHLDTFACTIDFKRAAYKAFETLAGEPVGALLTAYARGVNDAIANEFRGMYPIDSYYTHGFFRPVQLEAWEPVHSLAILHWLTYHQSHGWEDQVLAELVTRHLQATQTDETALRELFGDRFEALSASALASSPVDVFDATAGVLDVETVGGSFIAQVTTATATNGNGRRVVTGVDSWGNVKALGFWYANRLTVAGDDALDVRGASFPGVPLVLAGTTGHATWTFAQQPARLAAASPAGDRVRFVVDGSDDATAAAADATVRREVIRLREAPTAAAAAAAASSDAEQQQQHRWLLDVLVGESPAEGIDVLPLLAPELQAACAQLNVSQVWLRSPLVTDADRVLVRLMRFVHRANRASSAQSLATAHDELALAETLPWRLFATDAHGAAVVVPAPSSLHSAAPVTTVVAGASPHIRRQLRAEAAAAAAAIDASVFDDVYSPSGALLAQQLLQLLRQHPLVLRAQRRRGGNDNATATATDGDGDAGEASLLRNEVLHQADLLAIIALLEAFDGRYTPEAVVPSIVEAFRMFFLVETTREPLGPLATMFYGAYNVSAVLRATELEMRDAVSRLLAPYVAPLCPAATAAIATAANGDDTCPGPRVSWWVEQAGGLPEVLQRSLDGALEWLYKINEARAITTWQWQNHHHLLVHHPVSPAVTLLDSVLGAGPELVGGSYDSVLRSDYSGAARLFSDNMLHGVDTIGSAFRFVVRQQSSSPSASPSASPATAVVTDLATHVFTRDASVRHATAQRTFHGETASPLSTAVAPPVASAAAHFDL
eukprot:gene11767-8384_t